MLWAASAYLYKANKFHWVSTIPAVFMTSVVITYLSYVKIGFGLSITTSTIIGFIGSAFALVIFLKSKNILDFKDKTTTF